MKKQHLVLMAMISLALSFVAIPSVEALGWSYYDYGSRNVLMGTYSNGYMTERIDTVWIYLPLSMADLKISWSWEYGVDTPSNSGGLWYIEVDWVNTGWHGEEILVSYGWWKDGSGYVVGPAQIGVFSAFTSTGRHKLAISGPSNGAETLVVGFRTSLIFYDYFADTWKINGISLAIWG